MGNLENLKKINNSKRFENQEMYSPAHDLVFHILSRRMIIATKCDKSPHNLNKFILLLKVLNLVVVK